MSKPVLSLEAMADWLEKQPDTYYDWTSSQMCACGQYAKSLGIRKWTRIDDPGANFWDYANRLAHRTKPRMLHSLARAIRLELTE